MTDASNPARGPGQDDGFGTIRTQLPADLSSAQCARQAVHDALAAWGIDDPDRDTELLASELVANASEHAPGAPIGLALRIGAGHEDTREITCEVTDSSARLPQTRQASPDQERGRGMAIVAALASASGVRTEPAGKTTWFTLAIHDRINRIARVPDAEPEAGG
jgi:anti-sigma regulatory factor (Ser/Thr protein kinase)